MSKENQIKMTPAVKQTFSELEGRLAAVENKESTCTCSPKEEVKTYLFGGRVELPVFAGLPLPEGVGFHGYVHVELQDEITDEGDLIQPDREFVDQCLTEVADQKYPDNKGVTLCDVSILPKSWM